MKRRPPTLKKRTLDVPQLLQQALGLHGRGDLREAERLYEAVLKVQPTQFDALHFLGILRGQQGNPEAAVKLISVAVEQKPRAADAHSNLGVTLATLKRYGEAVKSFDIALTIKPDHADALFNRGIALVQLNRPEEAIASYESALAIRPDHAAALYNRGNALQALHRYEAALASYDAALAINANHLDALNGRGTTLAKQKRHDEAIETFDKALAINPGHLDALSNRGNVLQALNRHEEAIACYDKVLAIAPGHLDALYNRGVALGKLNRNEEALLSHQAALAINPSHAHALTGCANALQALNRLEEAIACYDQALAIKPDHADAFNNRGNALQALNRHQEAIASYDKALAIKPDYADALNNRAYSLTSLNRDAEAIPSYDAALAIDPAFKYALGASAYCRERICDWDNRDRVEERLVEEVRSAKPVSTPFSFLAISNSPEDQLVCAKTFVRDRYPAAAPCLWRGERYEHERIRLAYLSADFHEHATAYLMAELFEIHDRARFEIAAFSFGPDRPSRMRTRMKGAFERFIDVRTRNDREIANLLREMEIDIAVDLKGFTTDCRPGILAHRPAPIQVNYLGYPGTMGADYIDYILADRVVIPEEHHCYYTEKVVYLPDSYQVNDSKRSGAERTPTRAEVGLPENGFAFCSFNNNYKITPAVFDVWMRLLREVEGSVLWLLEANAVAARNLRREAAARGVAPGRLVFAPRARLADHLARHRLADLFLDTLPYNAHTTASDALRMGLPVLTCQGTTFAGRVAASLLNAIDLPELITQSLQDYEALALKLAADPAILRELKQKLTMNRLTAPLFDTDRFRRHIEAAYTTMWSTAQRGEQPKPFSVIPVSR